MSEDLGASTSWNPQDQYRVVFPFTVISTPSEKVHYYYYYYYYYIIVSFMPGSPTHTPGTNHVPRGYIVAAILSLLFMVPLCLVPALAILSFIIIIIIIIIIKRSSSIGIVSILWNGQPKNSG